MTGRRGWDSYDGWCFEQLVEPQPGTKLGTAGLKDDDGRVAEGHGKQLSAHVSPM
jgi:hypothetical protein